MMKRIVVVFLVLLLAGCGFQLRGSDGQGALPAGLNTVYVSGPRHDALVRAINSRLKAAGATLTEDATAADATLRLSPGQFAERIISLGDDASAREREINYPFAFSLIRADGQPLIDKQRLSVTRDYRKDETDILGQNVERDLIQREMIADAARLLMERIRVLARR